MKVIESRWKNTPTQCQQQKKRSISMTMQLTDISAWNIVANTMSTTIFSSFTCINFTHPSTWHYCTCNIYTHIMQSLVCFKIVLLSSTVTLYTIVLLILYHNPWHEYYCLEFRVLFKTILIKLYWLCKAELIIQMVLFSSKFKFCVNYIAINAEYHVM